LQLLAADIVIWFAHGWEVAELIQISDSLLLSIFFYEMLAEIIQMCVVGARNMED
jgi:hypothetical protein